MNEIFIQDRHTSRRTDRFFYLWFSFCLLGIIFGISAAAVCFSNCRDWLSEFCTDIFCSGFPAPQPLFFCSVLLLLVTVLSSQLPGGRIWLSLLIVWKAFSIAYVFGILYLLQQDGNFLPSAFSIVFHSFLLLPAFYFLTYHCYGVRLFGRGRYWFRYRILPVFLIFLYVLLAVWVEQMLWAHF